MDIIKSQRSRRQFALRCIRRTRDDCARQARIARHLDIETTRAGLNAGLLADVRVISIPWPFCALKLAPPPAVLMAMPPLTLLRCLSQPTANVPCRISIRICSQSTSNWLACGSGRTLRCHNSVPVPTSYRDEITESFAIVLELPKEITCDPFGNIMPFVAYTFGHVVVNTCFNGRSIVLSDNQHVASPK